MKKIKKTFPSGPVYEKGEVNFRQYSTWRLELKDFFESEKYFLTKEFIKPGMSILDIGGAAGGFGNALMRSVESKIDYTCIDPDKKCINFGKSKFPKLRFIKGYFPKDVPKKKYDLVAMLALFPQLGNWKQTLLDMASCSKRFINLSLLARLNGTTVVDKDVSYFYYLDSGERVYQVIHNLYELINFCSIHEMRAKKIIFYGYHLPKGGVNNRCVPNREQIRGNLLIELFPPKDKYPGRFGGAPKKVFGRHGVKTFPPSIKLILDRKPFDLYS